MESRSPPEVQRFPPPTWGGIGWGVDDEGGFMKRHPFVLVLLAASLFACASHQRPPALAGAGGGNGGGSGDRATSSRAQRLDPGPDVQVLSDDSTSGQDFQVSEPSGEGGPLADIHFDYDRALFFFDETATPEK